MLCILLACHHNTNNPLTKDSNFKNKKIPVTHHRDTLLAGYTYWWHSAISHPFTRECYLVFTGIVTKIHPPSVYKHIGIQQQEGVIKINSVKLAKNTREESYDNQHYFKSHCFYDYKLKEGDKVLVFIYEYDGGYAIPSQHSILKLESFNDPIVLSTEKYIHNKQNSLSIKDDLKIWEKYGLNKYLQEDLEKKEIKQRAEFSLQ